MKTRIISGAVLVAALVGLLFAVTKWSPVMYLAGAALSAIAVYEALYATGIVKNKLLTFVGCIYSVLFICRPFLAYLDSPLAEGIMTSSVIVVAFVIVQFALYLKFHKEVGLEGMLGMIILPILISFGFEALCQLVLKSNNMFYLVLIFCWSAIADTGAYFVGVAIGKHKMAPVISPKKSWEGLIGGMVISTLVAFGVCMLYNNLLEAEVNTLLVMAITPVFVLIGVMGDLTASLIKRKCGIKDFGKLIPGHGGILDRFDSMLMISVPLMTLLYFIPLIK